MPVNDPETAVWTILQEGRLAGRLPYLLLGALIVIGILATAVREWLGLSQRDTAFLTVGLFAALAAAGTYHVVSPGGSVAVRDGSLVVERRWRPALALPLDGMRVEPLHWTGRTSALTGLSAGMQVDLESGGRTVRIGANGPTLAEAAAETRIEEARTAPHVVLEEGAFRELLTALREHGLLPDPVR